MNVSDSFPCRGPDDHARRASAWVRRWSHLVPPGGQVLDVACGEGRHVAWFAERGHPVVGVDRSKAALTALAGLGLPVVQCEAVLADIEQGPWPFAGRQFAAVVVTNYLWRPLLSTLAASVAPGGVLIYETFAHGQARIGKPSRADFLLQPAELLSAFPELRVVAFEDGYEDAGDTRAARYVQRLVAVCEGVRAEADAPPRHLLG